MKKQRITLSLEITLTPPTTVAEAKEVLVKAAISMVDERRIDQLAADFLAQLNEQLASLKKKRKRRTPAK